MRLLACLPILLFLLSACRSLAGPPPLVPPVPVAAPEAPPAVPAPPAAAQEVVDKTAKGIEIKGIEIRKPSPGRKGKRKTGSPQKAEQQDKEVVQGQIKESIQRPVNSASVESKTIYSYVRDAIYLIYGAPRHVVDVQLQPGEKLTGPPVAGDTVRWIVGTAVDGSGANATTHVLIKPIIPNIETNFLIVTDRHSYRLYAESADTFFIPTVGWVYPEEEMNKVAQAKTEQQRLDNMVSAPAIVAADLNFRYRVKADGRYPWTPVRVFDDGSKTYIQMSPDMKNNEAPALFLKNGKNLNLVNYRIKSDYYIVDRLFGEAELRSGKEDRVRIIREGARPDPEKSYIERGRLSQ